MRQRKQAHLVLVRRLYVQYSCVDLVELEIIMSYLSFLMPGSLILEMGALSRLTGDSQYEAAALRALRKLWSLRSPLNLLGTTLDVMTGKWIEYSSGIGAGMLSIVSWWCVSSACVK